MKTIEETPIQLKTNIEKLASKILAIFPELEPDSQKTAVQLYRLLSKGNSFSREELTHAVGISVERINGILENWTGVFLRGRPNYWILGTHSKTFLKTSI